MEDFMNAFPEALRADAVKPIRLLRRNIQAMDYVPEKKAQHFFSVLVEAETLYIPDRLYDGQYEGGFNAPTPFAIYLDMLRGQDFTPKQTLIFFCLLTRHHNGFIREKAPCHIAEGSEPFVVPFVLQLASEYVYEILLQIKLRIDQFNATLYGAFIRENPVYFARLRQRMISYWNCYYRWFDYTSIDGGTHRKWQEPYIGFDIFAQLALMARTTP